MAATLNIVTTFIIQSRNLFVLAGNIVDGNIAEAKTLNSADNNSSFKISSVEYVDLSSGKSLIGLTIKTTSKEQLGNLEKFEPNDILIIY